MPLPGYYQINFTDPKKGSFVIEPYKTDGSPNPTNDLLAQNSTNKTTTFLLYGRGMPEYGERIQENLLNLMENFAGPYAPINATHGQMWFQTGDAYDIVNSDGTTRTITLSVDISALNPATITVYERTSDTFIDLDVDSIVGLDLNINLSTPFFTFSSGSYLFWSYIEPKLRIFNDPLFDGNGSWETANAVFLDSTEPEAPSAGELWLDPADSALGQQLKVWNGTVWISTSDNYLPLVGGIMAGNIDMGGFRTENQAIPLSDFEGANKKYVDDENTAQSVTLDASIDLKLDKSNGGTGSVDWTPLGDLNVLGADLNVNFNKITQVGDPTLDNSTDALPASYLYALLGVGAYSNPANVDTRLSAVEAATGISTGTFVNITGDTMTGDLNFDIPDPGVPGPSPKITFTNAIGLESHQIFTNRDVSGTDSSLIVRATGDINDQIIFQHDDSVSVVNTLTIRRDSVNVDVPITLGTGVSIYAPVGYVPGSDEQLANKKYVDDEILAAGGGGGTSDGVLDNVTYDTGLSTLTFYINDGLGTTIATDISHTHTTTTIDHVLTNYGDEFVLDELGGWNGIGPAPTVTTSAALAHLDEWKANTVDPYFTNSANLVLDGAIIGVNTVSDQFVFAGVHTSRLVIGNVVLVSESTGNDGVYTIAAISDDTINTTVSTVEAIPSATVDGAISYGPIAINSYELTTKQYVDTKTEIHRTLTPATGGAPYTTPQYVVGTHTLWIFVNGIKWIESLGYSEVGAVGTSSTTINMIAPVPTTGQVEIFVMGNTL